MKKTRITDRITYIQPDSMAQFSSCAGIIVQSRARVFIDMNMGREETIGLLEKEKPDAAVITHYHLDHSVWTRYVADHSRATVLIPKKEEPYLTSIDDVIARTAGPFGMAGPWRDFVENRLGYRPLKAHECYDDNTSFSDLAPEMVALSTPGHSPAHTSFYFPDDKLLFSGDMGLDRFGPWYGWSDCSILNIVESLLRLDGLDVHLILTSHGGMIGRTIRQALSDSIGHILKREGRIRDQLNRGLDKQAIIREGVFYTRKKKIPQPMRSFLDMWDHSMFNHHEALLREGGLSAFFPEIQGMSAASESVLDL